MSDLFELTKILQEKFPLFEYKIIKTYSPEYILVTLQSGVTTGVTELNEDTLKSLQHDHDLKVNWVKMMEIYPNLYFSRDCHSIWVKRDGRDADGIPYDFPLTEDQLAHWNEVAGQALQKGWFLCFICGKAKPRSEYGYYHFCAEYCKDCLKTHPEVERSARYENYE